MCCQSCGAASPNNPAPAGTAGAGQRVLQTYVVPLPGFGTVQATLPAPATLPAVRTVARPYPWGLIVAAVVAGVLLFGGKR